MVPHKVNNTPPPWIHSAVANQTADERCGTRLLLGLLYNYMNLNKLSPPSPTYLTDIRLVAIIGWFGAQALASGWAITLRDVHVTVIDVDVDNSSALEHMHFFGLISCHILLQSSGPTCPNPVEYLSGGGGNLQFCCPPTEKDHFSQFSEWRRCMCVSDDGLRMNHDLFCFVGSSGTRMRHRYVVNEDHHQYQCCLNICDLCIICQGFPIVPFVWVISFVWSPSRSQPHYLINCCRSRRKK